MAPVGCLNAVFGKKGVSILNTLHFGSGSEDHFAQVGLACYRGGVITARGRRW